MNRTALTRRGTTLLEAVAAVGLLAAGLSLTAQVMGWMAAERRANRQRQCAVQEAANCLERLHMLPWQQLNDAGVRDLTLSAEAQQTLPGGTLKVDVRDDPSQSQAKRIQIEVQWSNRAGQQVAPVRLTAWRWNVGASRSNARAALERPRGRESFSPVTHRTMVAGRIGEKDSRPRQRGAASRF